VTTPPNDGAAADADVCPADAPTNGDMCTGAETCRYGMGACACVRAMRGGGNDGGAQRVWQCAGNLDAAADPSCPPAEPTGGTSCADAGARTLCTYGGNRFCICDNMDQWRCF
jgi:hypothetical protein